LQEESFFLSKSVAKSSRNEKVGKPNVYEAIKNHPNMTSLSLYRHPWASDKKLASFRTIWALVYTALEDQCQKNCFQNIPGISFFLLVSLGHAQLSCFYSYLHG